MKRGIFFLLLICSIHAQCQTVDEASTLYGQKKYEQAKETAFRMIGNASTAAFANGLIGRIYTDQGRYDSAISRLQLAIKLDDGLTYISAWSYAYLGQAHAMTGEKEKGISELNKAIALNKTANSVKYAQHVLGLIEYSVPGQNTNYVSLTPHWITMEGTNITYYFQDTANMTSEVNNYIQQHEQAYVKINETFHAVLAKKMVFYVWVDRDLAKQLLHRELGFTDPETFTTNAAIDQTIGHEMAHTLSYWGWGTKPINTTRFINEGVAVAFDQNKENKNARARKAIAGKNIRSVLDIWKDDRAYANLVYPVGGAFVTYLYNKCTPKQFKEIIKDQTIENAQKILGKEQFGTIINEFNKLIGF